MAWILYSIYDLTNGDHDHDPESISEHDKTLKLALNEPWLLKIRR